MRLNHLDLQARDVQLAVTYFERFGLELQTSRTSPAIAIMTDGEGFTLVLQRHDAPACPEGFHLGFLVGDVDTVHRMHTQLRDAGIAVSDVDTNNRGTMIYSRAPDGYSVEVSCRRVSAH